MALLRSAGLLRPFLAVARTGNLSAAARELAVSQPALTKSVRKLEQQFGVALFDRRARGMTLTPSGAALLAHARLIEAQCRFADAELEALAHGEGGQLRVGAGTYWGPTLVPLAIARLQSRFPRLRVSLEVGVNASILPRLYAGEFDLVMSALPEASTLPLGIQMEGLGQLHQRIVAGRQHPLHRRRRVTVSDVARHPWVVYQHDADLLDRLNRVMRARGGEPANVAVVTTSLLAVIQLLKTGAYLACLPDAYLRAMPEPQIAVLPLAREIWSFPSGALYHASLRSFAPVTALIDALRDLQRERRRVAKAAR
jgi:DNA-binding transcriptional LysR family regulator